MISDSLGEINGGARAAQALTATDRRALIEEAMVYRDRGINVIPVHLKHPIGPWKDRQERPADVRTLLRELDDPRVTGVAGILGSASRGLACRDFDVAGAYDRWAAAHPDLAETLPTVKTARGYHVYFRGPNGFSAFGDGEYRADSGHYCLLPPSLHPGGTRYGWKIRFPDRGDIPSLDPEDAGLLTDHTQSTHQTHHTHCMSKHGNIPISAEEAIAATLPTEQGQRNRRLFALARRLKALFPEATVQELRHIVRRWYELALPVMRTKDWSETWSDFVVAWPRIRHAVNGKWASIVAVAATIDCDTGDHGDAAAKLIRLCVSLQAHHGAGFSWPLSCERAGAEAGVSKQRAGKLLRMLVSDGYIELVKPGGKKGSGQAAEYRYVGMYVGMAGELARAA